MNAFVYVLAAMFCAQAPAAPSSNPGEVATAVPAPPSATVPAPIGPSTLSQPASPDTGEPAGRLFSQEELDQMAPAADPSAFTSGVATPIAGTIPTGPDAMSQSTRRLFESDHDFDGFTTPLSNPVQSKDPRSLTEIRFLYLGDYSRSSTPVIGGGTFQVYAMQVRLALTDRLQVYADKDGLVMLSPKGGRSIFGMANLMAGAKYVFIRDVENQFLFSGALQYEAPTGYPSIFEGHGNGLLGVYGIVGKEFYSNWHFVSTFGQNIALNNSNSGYFMTTAHLDRRFGKFVPFYEANWFYYNQSGTHVPGLGIEGGGLLNLGASKVMGLNYVTNAIGFNYEFNKHVIFGVAYEFQLSSRTMLMNNLINSQLIFRY
ncbi:MAG: hypothetical protein ACLQGP_03960 [Isosphaeraceae bacterium]